MAVDRMAEFLSAVESAKSGKSGGMVVPHRPPRPTLGATGSDRAQFTAGAFSSPCRCYVCLFRLWACMCAVLWCWDVSCVLCGGGGVELRRRTLCLRLCSELELLFFRAAVVQWLEWLPLWLCLCGSCCVSVSVVVPLSLCRPCVSAALCCPYLFLCVFRLVRPHFHVPGVRSPQPWALSAGPSTKHPSSSQK